MSSKAISEDINDFFKGESVFFAKPPSVATQPTTPSPSAPNQEKPVRSNGRTTEQMHKRSTQANGAVSEQHKPPMDRTEQPMNEPPSDEGATTNYAHPQKSANARTQTGDQPMAILERLKQGKSEKSVRTERYSFEIYPQQKEQIEDFVYQFKKQTGEKISASQVIRDALSVFFQTIHKHGINQGSA